MQSKEKLLLFLYIVREIVHFTNKDLEARKHESDVCVKQDFYIVAEWFTFQLEIFNILRRGRFGALIANNLKTPFTYLCRYIY